MFFLSVLSVKTAVPPVQGGIGRNRSSADEMFLKRNVGVIKSNAPVIPRPAEATDGKQRFGSPVNRKSPSRLMCDCDSVSSHTPSVLIGEPLSSRERYTKQVGVFATARTVFYGNAFVHGLSYTRNTLSRTSLSDRMFCSRERPNKLCVFPLFQQLGRRILFYGNALVHVTPAILAHFQQLEHRI